tara:strand:- start:9555 stop:18386 length:8832 start_codon:yes stop_codon:yes gene_type:complete
MRWLCIATLLLVSSAGARAQVSLALGDASLAAGDSGSVSATISTDGAAVALQFDILYDPAIVSLGTVNGGAALTGSHSIASNPIAPGRDRVVITTSPVVPLNSGTLATVNLAVADTAVAGTTSLTFAGVVISDAAAQPLSPSSLTPGTITITGGATVPAEPEVIPASPVWVLVLLSALLAGLARRQLGRRARTAAISLITLLALAPLGTVTQAQGLPGDANGDGVIDAEDVRLIVERILERGVLPGDGDCNRDGTINVLDTVCSQIPFVPGETAPIILGPGDRSIPAEQAFEMNLFAADPDAGATQAWELVSGPAALSVEPGGVLTWTPAIGDIGSNEVTVRVTDDTGRTDEASFAIAVFTDAVVESSNAPPQLTVPPDQSLPVGTPLSAQASATDPDVGDTLTFRLVNGPSGMSIDADTGALSWTPQADQARTADVVVAVSDAAGAEDFGSFTVTATPLNTAPTAVNDIYIARKGETLVIPAAEGVLQNDRDPQDDPLTATRLSDPTLGTVDSFNPDGSLSYTPGEPEGIEIGLLEKCEVDGGIFTTSAGTASAADVDGDGVVELAGLVAAGLGARVFVVDPRDCSASVNLIPGTSGQPTSAPISTLVNLDDDPELEVVTQYFRFADEEPSNGPGDTRIRLMAFNLDGSPLSGWPAFGLSEHPNLATGFNSEWNGTSPVAVDLGGDGDIALLAGFTQVGPGGQDPGTCRAVVNNTTCNAVVAWDGRTGAVRWQFVGGVTRPSQPSMSPTIVDLDMDGDPEIIWNQLVLDHEGNLLFELPVERTITAEGGELYGNDLLTVAVANFDNDPFPEIVGFDATNFYLFSHDGAIQWQRPYNGNGFDFPWAGLTLAELDGDPFPEMVTMLTGDDDNILTLRAFDSDGEPLWSQPEFEVADFHQTRSSSPVAIDLDGDGIDELIQMKAATAANGFVDAGLYIIEGSTGDVIASARGLRTANGFDEPLTVADLDGDGSAEIVTTFVDTLGLGRIQIWDNLPGEPFPPARPIRSQTNQQPTWVNVDGSLPASLEPHWLQPGRNYWNRIVPDLDPLAPEQDSFTYRASDGEFDSAEATVNIEIRPNGNPPFFLSDPVRGASAGTRYRYQPLVTDIDPGDSVSFELLNAPVGMTIDPVTGELDWYPQANGEYPVSIAATDTLGLSSAQIFSVAVGDPVEVPDLIGLSEVAADTALDGVGLALGSRFVRSDPVAPAGAVLAQNPPAGAIAELGSGVQVTLSSGPTQADTDGDGDGFTPNQGDCNDSDASVYPGAPEIDGDGIDQSCNGIDGNKTLVAIEVTPTDRRLLAGRPQPLRAMGIFEDGTAQDVTGIATWTGGPTFSSASAGSFTAEASFDGITGSADFTVVDGVADDVAPIARINAPAKGAELTAPTTVSGTANDSNLLRWELAYRYAGEDDFVIFAESTAFRSAQPLAEFDPTTLLNGLYTLRLRVFDRGGNVSEDSTTVRVEGQLKVGNFTLRYVDLELPLSGIPIRLERSYDSRDKRMGDFGVGWQLAVNSVEIRTNRELGSGWQVFRQGLSYGLLETDLHVVAVRLPGGRIEAFEMVVSPNVSPIVPFPPFSQSVRFRPLPGTLGTLRSLEPNDVSILDAQPGPVSLRLDSNGNIYNPTLFRYTTPDGTRLDLDTEDGIQRAETPGGQVLTFTPTSITHSNGTIVEIERDSVGRITRITDPGGFSQSYSYDANGDLRAHSDQEDFVTRFDYDRDHNIIGIFDPLNRTVVRNEYDEAGRLISSVNANGDVVTYTHDVHNRQELVTDPDGFTSSYEYDDRGNITRIVDPAGGVTTATYDDRGNRLSQTNAEGETSLFAYDGRDNLLSITTPIGATTHFGYDSRDLLTSRTDPLGRVTRYQYDSASRPIAVIDALGNTSRAHTRDQDGNLVATENARGAATLFEYTSRGYRAGVVDARGARSERQLNANGHMFAETDPRGGVTTLSLDARGIPNEVVAPAGNTMSYEFNGLGQLVRVSDELGNAVVRTLDATGRVIRAENPDGTASEMRHDGRGNRTAVIDRSGRETRYEYDSRGRRIRVILPDGGVMQTAYDAVGRITSETDPNGNVTSYEYDAAGRNTAMVDALGNRTEFTYDLVGNLISRLDARGNRTDYVYDVLDRLIRTEYPDGSTETIDYDPLGNIIAETDRLGRTKSYTYDPNDNLSSVTDIDGAVTTYSYDENNNRIRQTDANGHSTRMVYDGNDRLLEKQYPDGSTERFEYDAGGRVARTVLPDGKYIDASYDGFGRPTGHNLNGEGTESFTYDGAGRLTQAVNLWGTVDYRYDADGRVIEITSEGGHAVRYGYDALGNRTSISTRLSGQAERTTSYTYDVLNRLATVVEPDGDTTTYSYDPVGNVASINYPNGVVSSFTYDNLNQLTRIEHRQGATTLAAYDYTLDAGGRRLRVDHANGDSVAYSYDSADRLLQETHRNAGNVVIFEQTYSYDDVGNRITRQVSGQAQTLLAYDSADKLLTAGATRHAYDANGRLISTTAPQGTINYAYDVEGQLLRVTTSTGTVTYGYDASGKRRQRVANGVEQNFLLDEASLTGYDQALLAFNENDVPLVEYHWGDRLISADDGSNDRFYHFDASRNTRLLTDETGAVSDTIDYDAFGNVRNRTGVGDTPYGFAGEWQEEAEGLVFLRARFYDPETGRFISRDPFAGTPYDPVSLHRYLYANANPIMNTDPTGELTLTDMAVAGAIATGISLIVSGFNGESYKEAIPKAIIAGIFGAAGAVLGGGAAVATELATTRAFAAVVLRESTRKGIVVIANAVAQATVSAVWGVFQLSQTDDNYNADLGRAEATKLFLITFVIELMTGGYYQPAVTKIEDTTRTVTVAASPAARKAAAEQALERGGIKGGKRLFGQWQDSGENAIAFINRMARGSKATRVRGAARSIKSTIDAMTQEAELIIRTDLVSQVRLFPHAKAASGFIEGAKQAASPIFEAAMPN